MTLGPRWRVSLGWAVARTVTLTILVAVSGCVTQRRYDDVQTALQRTLAGQAIAATTCEEEIKRLDRDRATVQASLTAQSQEVANLRDRLQREGITVDVLATEREQVQRDLARAQASQAEMARALEEYRTREREAQRRVAEFRAMLLRFQSLVDAGKLAVRIVEGRMVLTLPMDILFQSGSAKISTEGKTALGEIGAILRDLGEASRRFQVEGHTDDVPIRTRIFPSNWELSSARALAVVTELLGAGVRPEQVSGAGFAEHQPRAANVDDQGRALNRRIEIVILPDLRGLPGYDELQKLAREK